MTLKETERLSSIAVSQKVLAGDLLSGPQHDLQGDREIMLRAVPQDWQALKWASDDLKGDREIMLIAVSQYWEVLKWASADLKGDREIILKRSVTKGRAGDLCSGHQMTSKETERLS